MNRLTKYPSVLIGIGFLLAMPVSQAGAQANDFRARFEYVAQFTCGVDPPPAVFRVVPGLYATAVNIHNPTSRAVTFRKNVSLTFPPAAQAGGAVSEYQVDVLEPNQALQVDCQEIPAFFDPPPPTPYIQGYVVIQSPQRLNVNATYTAGSPGGEEVSPLVNSIVVQEISENRARR